MAGYKREARTIRLVFDDPDLDGLEVVTRSVPLGVYLDMVKLAQQADETANASAMTDLLDAFGGHGLVSWNLLDEDGMAVPASMEGMRTQDTMFMLQIVMAWLGALGAAPAPLVGASANGSTSDYPSSGQQS